MCVPTPGPGDWWQTSISPQPSITRPASNRVTSWTEDLSSKRENEGSCCSKLVGHSLALTSFPSPPVHRVLRRRRTKASFPGAVQTPKRSLAVAEPAAREPAQAPRSRRSLASPPKGKGQMQRGGLPLALWRGHAAPATTPLSRRSRRAAALRPASATSSWLKG